MGWRTPRRSHPKTTTTAGALLPTTTTTITTAIKVENPTTTMMSVRSNQQHQSRRSSKAAALTTFAFVFNLLIGAGALAIPKPFAQAGAVLGAPFLALLCVFSLATALFMVEVLLTMKVIERAEKHDGDDAVGSGGAEPPAPGELPGVVGNHHELEQPLVGGGGRGEEAAGRKMEMGTLAKSLLTPTGARLTYVVLCAYLFGDLSIYAVTIPKSLTALVCPHEEHDLALSHLSSWHCKNIAGHHGLTSDTVYRGFVLLLGIVQLPFVFQNVQKTLLIQMLSIAYRWSAFIIIIAICVVQMLSRREDRNWTGFARQHDFNAVLPLFGVSTYSFMCHHSLPSLLDPMLSSGSAEQLSFKRLRGPVAGALLCCLAFYLLMNCTVALRWQASAIEDVITLNFQNFKSEVVAVFLELFPVCTLGASFPIIACTLRNNLQSLVVVHPDAGHGRGRGPGGHAHAARILKDTVLPVLVLVLPLTIAFFTQNVETLVSITGSYGGCAIEFIIPALLVHAARKKVKRAVENRPSGHLGAGGGLGVGILASPYAVPVILGWSIVCLVLVTIHNLS